MPQAVVVREFGGPESLVVEHRGELVPGPGEVVIDLRAAALNRRDLRVVAGGWPGVTVPLVPGSDGAGVVRALGGGVSGIAEGDEVVVLPALDWGDDPRVLGPSFRILGGPDDGTFAEQVRVPAANVFPKPSRLPFAHAAALPLAGLTVWRALFTRGGLQSGQSVLVLGAGAGTSTFAVQIARAAGARVFVTSSSTEQDHALARARRRGRLRLHARRAGSRPSSSAAVAASTSCWTRRAPGSRAWRACARAAASSSSAAPQAPTAELDVRGFYFKQIDVVGTMMGSPVDFRALLRACELQTWTPIVDSERPLAEAGDAFRRQAGERAVRQARPDGLTAEAGVRSLRVPVSRETRSPRDVADASRRDSV